MQPGTSPQHWLLRKKNSALYSSIQAAVFVYSITAVYSIFWAQKTETYKNAIKILHFTALYCMMQYFGHKTISGLKKKTAMFLLYTAGFFFFIRVGQLNTNFCYACILLCLLPVLFLCFLVPVSASHLCCVL